MLEKRSVAALTPVLIVDDEAHARLFLSHMLKKLGFEEVTLAANGEEALKYAQERAYSLILLDISMPRMTGLEALGKIRPLQPKAKIVMLTSLTTRASVTEALAKGADQYLRKDEVSRDSEAHLREVIASLDAPSETP